MIETVIANPFCRLGCVLLGLAALSLSAAAQQPGFPGAPSRNPACIRLEAQLATIDRGGFEGGKSEQVKRLEDASSRQQFDLDRLTAQAKRMGCEGRGFFSLFGGQPQQCGPINNQIQQLRANLDRTLGDLQSTQGSSADREGQRRAVLAALGQADCGPQYKAYANRGGFLDNLFGGNGPLSSQDPNAGNTYRTLCVRTCDGFYFPISYSTVPSKFADDEKVCQAMCPAAEVMLFSHRNPGEDVTQATSVSGRSYTELPNAFAYRKAFNPTCSCKGVSQTWADALKHLDDQTVERGDILVNEERARQLSQPQTDAKGKAIRSKVGIKGTTPVDTQATTAVAEKPQDNEPVKRHVRTVGPTFLPVR